MGFTNEERACWAALHEIDGLGPLRLPILIDYFGSAKAVWQASLKELTKTGIGQRLAGDIVRGRRRVEPLTHLKTLAQMGVRVLTYVDKEYPENLKEIEDRPNILYIKGRIEAEDNQALAVVGTRKPTLYGRDVAEKLVHELVGSGLCIVSGLARGIDSVAHRAALAAGGRTIAVMATGIDQIYPPENKELAEKIALHGALVSEFAPGYTAVPGSFPARNRIVSGMSLGVLVIEGAAKSGTKITARHALDQGREVFAVPGPITSQMSEAPAELLKLGAKLVLSATDVLEEICTQPVINKAGRGSDLEFKPESDLEKKLYQKLVNGQMHIDELVRFLDVDTAEVAATLTQMEVKGIVKHLGGMVYARS